ncbi:MAG: trypsin-like peptidase domain-containing protein [Candidatus Aureabacteria bacterium]|nr:trypsin-like peptidase domain-containing protein [Candidatus Auribacterota bacterium]
MKRYILALLLMVICASLLIVSVANYVPVEQKKRRVPSPPVSEGEEKSIDEIVERVGPAVVAIDTRERRTLQPRFNDPILRYFLDESDMVAEIEGIGSGVIFDPEGYVVTNSHVVGDAQEIGVTLANGRQMDAELCAVDPDRDLALLKLPEEDLPVAELGDSDHLMVGQWVLAFGNPFGTASKTAQPSVSVGVISALHRRVKVPEGLAYEDLIQTDAAINSGNDGGPLVDLGGRVIGLNTLILTSSGASTGVGFSIPVSVVREGLGELTRQCKEKHPEKSNPKGSTAQRWHLPW